MVRFLLQLIVIMALLVVRRADALTNPQFWAEDATIFFKTAFEQPTLSSLLAPYAGYLHLIPRCVALVCVRLFEPEAIPLVFNGAAILIAGLCLTLFASTRFRYLVRSDAVRFAACVLVAYAQPGTEIINMLTNVQWYLTLGSLLLLVMPVASIAGGAAVVVAQLVAGLTCPMNLFLVP
ncbi:MAG: hypothetical protein V3T70_07815, partial [Phycisphaerae bacterium]